MRSTDMRKHVQTHYIKVQTWGVKADVVNYLTTSECTFITASRQMDRKANTSGKNKVQLREIERDRH